MDPHVYPDSPNKPLSLVKGTSSSAGIEQLTSSIGGDQTMFIRVAMSTPDCAALPSPIPPTLSLQAGMPPATPGDFVPLTSTTQGIYKAPGTNPADYIGDAKVEPDPSFGNVYIITFTFFASAFATYLWHLKIQNNDGAAADKRDFTWVVSGTEANTLQPWIDVVNPANPAIPATLTYNVLTGTPLGLPFEVRNKGTRPMTVSDLTPSLPNEFVLSPSLPVTINPGRKTSLTITFKSSTLLSISSTPTVNITPDDTTAGTSIGHNNQLSITATAQSLEVVLLLDASGSMDWLPNGNTTTNTNLKRLSELKLAANNFLHLLAHFGEGKGKFGIARFPGTDPTNPSTYDVQTMTNIPGVPGIKPSQDKVSAITAINGTPMGEGIDRVLNSGLYFASDPTSVDTNRRRTILMTDGAENTSSAAHKPTRYAAMGTCTPTAGGPTLCDKKIGLLAIGYGLQGASNVDFNLLETLRAGSYQAGSPGLDQVIKVDQDGKTYTELDAAFRQAIKHGLAEYSPSDPSGVFYSSQAEARHSVMITIHDGKAAFSLSWNTPDDQLLRLELFTPKCELITPENADEDFTGVHFVGNLRSHMYLIDSEFIHGTDESGAEARYGNWIMKITSPRWSEPVILLRAGEALESAAVQQENYTYDVILESHLRMDLRMDQNTYFAGDPIRVSAQLTSSGAPIKNAAVLLSTTAPTLSVDNWLASIDVPDEIMEQAREKLSGQDSTPLMIKAVAVGLMELTFPGGYSQGTIPMIDAGETGVYEAVISNTSTPEQYTFYVTAIGITEEGVSFRREGKVETKVRVRPDPAYTHIDVRYAGIGLANIVLTAGDRFGNVLLVNPDNMLGFGLAATGADLGVLTSNLNGSYTSQMTFDPALAPVVSLLFDGEPLIEQTLPTVGKLIWVDRVLHFKPGAEAARGANQHLDPEVMLGNFFDKPQDAFVALGAHGILMVAIKNRVILPVGKADITVFVAPKKDPRSYRVYVYVPPRRDMRRKPPTDLSEAGWVVLGESSGNTASFSLNNVNVPYGTAVAVLDLSGQTRDRDGNPLEDPGICIMAVGAEKVRKQRGGDDDDDHDDDDHDDDHDDSDD
jgi:hypothetical protein